MSQPLHVPSSVAMVTPERIVQLPWLQFFIDIASLFTAVKTVVVPIGKLTGGGTNGSLTFTNGLLTSYVDPT
jgi:hypothetical protein